MKIYGKLLTLCVVHANVLATAAAFVQAPKSLTSKRQVVLRSFSYGNLGESDKTSTSAVPSSPIPGAASSGPIARTTPPTQAAPTTAGAAKPAKDIWETASPIIVQGGSLRTWSLTDPYVEMVQVLMKTEGRPLNADVDLWHGPDNTPQKMRIYVEDGSVRPFSAILATPRGQNAVAIRNTGHLEFPMLACVEADTEAAPGVGIEHLTKQLTEISTPRIVQGGAIRTYPFEPSVSSVQVLLKTDGRPLNARLELLQGPNNIKQVIELYTEDGMERPFFAIIETPGSGNVVRVVNTATMEYPLSACVEPYLVESGGGPGGKSGASPFILS